MTKEMLGVTRISRAALIAKILARSEPLIVLEAPLGMGKSMLLQEIADGAGLKVHIGPVAPPPGARDRLWDLDLLARGRIPAPVEGANPGGTGRLILAKRPETRIAGLERAIAYGQAFVFDAADLLLTQEELAAHLDPEAALGLWRATGGWPLALGAGVRQMDERRLSELFAAEFVPHLEPGDLIWLEGAVAGMTSRIAPSHRLSALVRGPSGGILSVPTIARALAVAVQGEIRVRASRAEDQAAVVAAYRSAGRAPEAIMLLQDMGESWAALAVLAAEQGFLCFYRYGPAVFEQMMARFPADQAQDDETLVMCRCLQALKHGDVARTQQMLIDRLGPDALNLLAVFSGRTDYSLAFRLFRIVLLIYEDAFVSDQHLEQMYQLIREVPDDAHFERGTFYNSMLEVYIRRRRFAEAEEAAKRALYHYAAADLPIMQFYIRLHQSVIRLMDADSRVALKLAEVARGHLRNCDFESRDDLRLLTLLSACADYEAGHPGPLARFLSQDMDDFLHAELWPTVVDLALHYGSQALGEQFSTIAALGFLNRWRVHQAQNRQFQTMLDLREAAILQNGNRWHEAGEVLSKVLPGLDRTWVLSPAADLARLDQRDALTLAFTWLRQIAFEQPQHEMLPAALDAIVENPRLTGHQRLCVHLWRAHVRRHRRDHAEARKILERVLDQAGHLGAVGPLAEQRYFLEDLLGQKRIGAILTLSEPAQQILRRLRTRGMTMALPGGATGLTRRETKLLMMITEGSSNKFIANALGLSESTVKFHLKNLYGKLGCHRRREAIDAARALRLVS
jgi:DNA-binding CsgD family transcriptional regulator